VTVVETERLLLRRWRPEDAEPFAAINADPLVTRYVGGPLTREASDALLARSVAFWESHGYGRAAVEDKATGELLGFCGLGGHPATAGETEIGWRLASHVWGRGLATEAATAMRDLAFSRWGLARLVSVAVPENPASLGVMRNIGMTHWRDVEHDGLLLTVYVGWPP
jgi:RimJ/RimL family protein N-acetyltransferase